MKYQNRLEIKKARELLEVLGITETSLPVDVHGLARKNGISVMEAALPHDVSGVLYTDSAPPVILINSGDSEARKRFSIAHELGHFFMQYMETLDETVHVDKEPQMYFRSTAFGKGIHEAEIQANRFASELLIPTSILSNMLYENPLIADLDDDENIKRLTEKFNVSRSAISYAIAGVVQGYRVV